METFTKVQTFIETSIVKRSVKRTTQTQIFLKNGSRIVCLPSGRFGSTLRGLTVHFAVVDEAAFIYDEVISNAIFPMLAATNGKIWMLTTPWDKNHITYRCFNNPDWSIHHLPSSVNPLITNEFLQEQRNLHGEEKYQMEYEAVFIDDAKSYFPMTLLRPCIGEPLTTLNVGNYHLGYDPGGRHDYAAYVVVEPQDDLLHTRLIRAVKGLPYTTVSLEVADLNNKHRLQSAAVDQTGLGNPIIEHLKELGLPINGYILTNKIREEILSNLKILLEQRKIVLPDNIELLNSLNCIEYERSRTGTHLFTHREGTHDDLAYALALACMQVKRSRSGGVVVKI